MFGRSSFPPSPSCPRGAGDLAVSADSGEQWCPKKVGVQRSQATRVVSEAVFKQVYDSPQSLPGKHCWLTADADVRASQQGNDREAAHLSAIGAQRRVTGVRRRVGLRAGGLSFCMPSNHGTCVVVRGTLRGRHIELDETSKASRLSRNARPCRPAREVSLEECDELVGAVGQRATALGDQVKLHAHDWVHELARYDVAAAA